MAKMTLLLPMALLAVCGDAIGGDMAPTMVTELPLKRGFYVASDTPCEQASNATLLLLRRDGIGGARDFCEFRQIEAVDAAIYRVTEACADLQGGDAVVSLSTYRVASPTDFTARSEQGWESSARYCEQSSLPEPWRDNDVDDLIR